MLLAMLVVGCAAGVGKWLWPMGGWVDGSGSWRQLTIMALFLVAPTFPVLWCMLGLDRPWRRMPLAWLLVVLIATTMAWAMGGELAGCLLVFCLQAALQMGTLLVVRRCGYRLASRRQWERQQ